MNGLHELLHLEGLDGCYLDSKREPADQPRHESLGALHDGRNAAQGARALAAQGYDVDTDCAGAQLDFPAQQFQGVAEVWMPFEQAIVIGWR